MTVDAKTAANQLSRLVHLPCTSTTSTRAITADAIRAQVIIAWNQGNWRSICDGRTPVPLRLVRTPAVCSTGHSAGMTDGGSGDADTINSGPKWAASQANLRDHAIRLRERRWRYCLRRSCDG